MLGVISGAAIAIVLLTWFVGVPQFTIERPALDVPAQVVDLVEAVPETPTREPVEVEESAEPEVVPDEEPLLSASAPAEEAPPAPNDFMTNDDATMETIEAVLPAAAEPDMQWFAFWSPFRSQIAAEGFVSQLQRVTGLDYRVVKVKPGVYEVAFAYSDNAELDLNLSTISAATGLDLPGDR